MVKKKLELPMKNRDLIKETGYENFLKKTDIIRITMIAKSNYSHLLWFKIIYIFGLNINEFINIRVSNIDFLNRKLLIEDRKNRKRRTLAIPDHIINELRIQCCHKVEDDFLFTGRLGSLHVRTVQKLFKKISDEFGSKINVPLLKKSLIYHLYQENWDEEIIVRFFGIYQRRTVLKTLKEIKKTENEKYRHLDSIFKKIK